MELVRKQLQKYIDNKSKFQIIKLSLYFFKIKKTMFRDFERMIDSAMQGLDDMFGSSQNSTRTQTRSNTSRRPRNSGSSENHSRRHGFLLRFFFIQGLRKKIIFVPFFKSVQKLSHSQFFK